MKMVLVLPGEPAKEIDCDGKLGSLQKLVDGYIEVVEDNENPSRVFILNEEGKLNGMQPNRTYVKGVDVIHGPFIIARDNIDTGEFEGLTEDDISELLNRFKTPETFGPSYTPNVSFGFYTFESGPEDKPEDRGEI